MTTVSEARPGTTPRADAPKLMLAAICACAKQNGIATITISYDGHGDEGGIDGIKLVGPVNDASEATEIAMPDMPCSTWNDIRKRAG